MAVNFKKLFNYINVKIRITYGIILTDININLKKYLKRRRGLDEKDL